MATYEKQARRAQFERRAERDAELAATHRSKVQFVPTHGYRGRCSCLWTGPWRESMSAAELDRAEH